MVRFVRGGGGGGGGEGRGREGGVTLHFHVGVWSGVYTGGEVVRLALEEVTMGHTWVSWVVNIGCGAGSLLSCPVCSHD